MQDVPGSCVLDVLFSEGLRPFCARNLKHKASRQARSEKETGLRHRFEAASAEHAQLMRPELHRAHMRLRFRERWLAFREECEKEGETESSREPSREPSSRVARCQAARCQAAHGGWADVGAVWR